MHEKIYDRLVSASVHLSGADRCRLSDKARIADGASRECSVKSACAATTQRAARRARACRCRAARSIVPGRGGFYRQAYFLVAGSLPNITALRGDLSDRYAYHAPFMTSGVGRLLPRTRPITALANSVWSADLEARVGLRRVNAAWRQQLDQRAQRAPARRTGRRSEQERKGGGGRNSPETLFDYWRSQSAGAPSIDRCPLR